MFRTENPEDGEEVELDCGIKLKVQGIDQNRICKVVMTLPEETAQEDPENPGEEKEQETDAEKEQP